MAAMDQGKLDTMVSKINSEASNYVTNVQNNITTFKQTFNENWVSVASQKLATEVKECVDSLAIAIKQTFDSKNDSIKMSVNNFNTTESENISYSGFSFGQPNVDMTLNAALPNGKVGVADGADLNTIETPMNSLVTTVTTALDNINNAVSSADAFSAAEQEALTSSVSTIKSNFTTKMDELKSSLSTRMSGEITARDELNRVNVSNLGA